MLSRRIGTVLNIFNPGSSQRQLLQTEHGRAIHFTGYLGALDIGDKVLLNCTANDLHLGTGGYDYVMARLHPPPEPTALARRESEHLMKLRYTPLQHSMRHIEDEAAFEPISAMRLAGMPVVATELHSQVAAIVAAVALSGASSRLIMTDAAALDITQSELVLELQRSSLGFTAITVGQATGSGFATAVTPHNALLHARHEAKSAVAIIGQGPGNTGTGTKYGFSGIEQASNLDIAAALGGTPIACVRAGSGDARERHQGVSHHTITVLELVRSRCIVPLPEGLPPVPEWLERHDVRIVPREKTQPALDLLKERGINVTTMGRGIGDDPLFFHAAAAAGVVAAETAAAIAAA